MGYVGAGHGNEEGESEIAGLGLPDYYAKGFGKEGAEALKEYVLALSLDPEKAIVNKGDEYASPIKRLHATAREDNIASQRIQEELGMHRGKTTGEGKERRIHFTLSIEEIRLCKIVSGYVQSRRSALIVGGFLYNS